MNVKGLGASADAIRTLTIDAIERSQSGHPGLPLGCAEIGSYLFGEVLRHNPENPSWLNRDRFVLSAGHGSMLIYSLLHLSGYNLTIDDIRDFRQLRSKTPGHPEFGLTEGVETSTGPLGQGIANAVGMAIAGKINETKFNTKEHEIFNNRVFCLTGDGCLMEGLSYEACSMAGHLGLNNLVLIYDRNEITIEGKIDITFTENIVKRFESMGWESVEIDGHDFSDIKRGFDLAEKMRISEKKPVIIIAKTIIGKGAPNKQGSSACHGAPLGESEAKACKLSMGLDPDQHFKVEDKAYEYYNEKKKNHIDQNNRWNKLFDQWKKSNPSLSEQLKSNLDRVISPDIFKRLSVFEPGSMHALRDSSHKTLKEITADLDFVISGSADLGGSNKSLIKDGTHISRSDFTKYNIQYGVREHAMGAVANGIYLYGGITPIVSTFLAFATYMLPPIRMAALMEIPVVFLFSHDSIFVGEDGPTHQPVEHLTTLRMIPNLNVMRPSDANETRKAWEIAFTSKKTPSVIVTTRQKVRTLSPYRSDSDKGAYIVHKEKQSRVDLIIFSSGSEVDLSISTAEELEKEGLSVRVVNVFSDFLFEKQSDEYKAMILAPEIKKRAAVEVASSLYWYKFTGIQGRIFGIDSFGHSGKAEAVAMHFGFTVNNIAEGLRKYIKG